MLFFFQLRRIWNEKSLAGKISMLNLRSQNMWLKPPTQTQKKNRSLCRKPKKIDRKTFRLLIDCQQMLSNCSYLVGKSMKNTFQFSSLSEDETPWRKTRTEAKLRRSETKFIIVLKMWKFSCEQHEKNVCLHLRKESAIRRISMRHTAIHDEKSQHFKGKIYVCSSWLD